MLLFSYVIFHEITRNLCYLKIQHLTQTTATFQRLKFQHPTITKVTKYRITCRLFRIISVQPSSDLLFPMMIKVTRFPSILTHTVSVRGRTRRRRGSATKKNTLGEKYRRRNVEEGERAIAEIRTASERTVARPRHMLALSGPSGPDRKGAPACWRCETSAAKGEGKPPVSFQGSHGRERRQDEWNPTGWPDSDHGGIARTISTSPRAPAISILCLLVSP